MSLRDTFAVQIIAALLVRSNWQGHSVQQMVAVAYQIADLMVTQASSTAPPVGTPFPPVLPIPMMP